MGLFDSIFGKKAKVAEFRPVDLIDEKKFNAQAEQGKAVEGNLANFGNISKLTSQVNSLNQSELNRMLEMATPGYGKIRDEVSGQIMDQLTGELPDDVQDLVSRKAAQQSLFGGFGGSGMGRNLELRDLGLNELQYSQNALNNAQSWLASARTTAQYDPSSMFISPTQQLSFAQNNAQLNAGIAQYNSSGAQATQQMKNNIKAAPNPVASGIFNTGLYLTGSLLGAAGGYFTGQANTGGNLPSYGGGAGGGGGSGGGLAGLFQQQSNNGGGVDMGRNTNYIM